MKLQTRRMPHDPFRALPLPPSLGGSHVQCLAWQAGPRKTGLSGHRRILELGALGELEGWRRILKEESFSSVPHPHHAKMVFLAAIKGRGSRKFWGSLGGGGPGQRGIFLGGLFEAS